MEFEGGIRGFQKIMFLYLALAGVTKGLSPKLVLRAFFEVFNLSDGLGSWGFRGVFLRIQF